MARNVAAMIAFDTMTPAIISQNCVLHWTLTHTITAENALNIHICLG